MQPRALRRFTVYPDGRVFGPSGTELTPFPVKGYLRVTRYESGKYHAEPIHRLVCEAFHGPAPEGKPHARHLNGNPLDNRAANLEWGSQPENEADKIAHGTARRGARHTMAKLDDVDVEAIRGSHESARELAFIFGVHPATIRNIRAGRTWRAA